MLTIIIFIIIALLFFYFNEFRGDWQLYDSYKNPFKRFSMAMWGEWDGFFACVILFTLIGTVISLLFGALLSFGFSKYTLTTNLQSDKPIYALQDNAAYIWRYCDSDSTRLSYVVEEDMGFHVKSHSASQCFIQYTTDAPHVKTYSLDFKLPFLEYLFFNPACDEYIFYVPYDSIITEYKVDLKGD